MILPEPGTWLLLALLGGVATLDGTSFGQFMVSRPLVAATLAGWLVGAPAQGAAVGLVLEALHLGVLPVGAARYPEGAPAAVGAGAVWALSPGSGTMLALVLLLALGWESFSGATVQRLRQFNTRFSVEHGVRDVDPAALERGHLTAVGVDFARGALLSALAVGVMGAAAALLPAVAALDRPVQVGVGALVAAALAAGLRSFGRRRIPFFLAGAGLGAAVLVLL